MDTQTNRAAWLPETGAQLEVKAAPYSQPADDEIVVKNHAVAVNPIDWILAEAGTFVFSWIRFPLVLGSDLAGEVVQVGNAVARFKPGDRVLAHALGTDRPRSRSAEGAFQTYTIVRARMASPIPDELSYERACVVPLGCSTAACALFEKDQLGLERPSMSPQRKGQAVLVWGGSTSVGSNAIQLAVAAGYDVVTTASPNNFAYVKRLGASQAFDYNSTTVIKDIITALNGTTIAGAIAIGPTSALACLDIVRGCKGNKFVSMATFPVSFDGFSRRPRIVSILRVMRQAIPFGIAVFFKTRLHGIRSKFIFGSSLAYNDVSTAVYTNYLPDALARKAFIAAPDPHIVGNTIESIQAGLDVQRKGVSASKVVISLP